MKYHRNRATEAFAFPLDEFWTYVLVGMRDLGELPDDIPEDVYVDDGRIIRDGAGPDLIYFNLRWDDGDED